MIKKILISVVVFIGFLMVIGLLSGESAPKGLTNIAEYGDWSLKLLEGRVEIDEEYEAGQVLKVRANFTNNGQEPLYAMSGFDVVAFQNDKELEMLHNITDDNLTTEIRNGQTLTVTYTFELPSEAPVEVLVRTPTASAEKIGCRMYLKQ